VYISLNFPLEASWEYAYNTRHFFEALEGHTGTFFYHFDNMRMTYGELVYVPVVWFLYRAINEKKREDMFVSALFMAVFLFYSLSATKMPAYTIIASPAIFIMTSQAYFTFQRFPSFPKLMKIIAFFLILLPIRYSIERVKPFATTDISPKWNDQLMQIANSRMNTDSTVIFNCPYYTEAMFITKCVCYEKDIDSISSLKLKEKNFNIIRFQ
jgi:hypothetical protein